MTKLKEPWAFFPGLAVLGRAVQCWGVPKEHQSPVSSQVYKLLTTADAELPKGLPKASP